MPDISTRISTRDSQTVCGGCGEPFSRHGIVTRSCPFRPGGAFVVSAFEDARASGGALLPRSREERDRLTALLETDRVASHLASRRARSNPRIVGYTADATVWCTNCAPTHYGSEPRTSEDQPMQDENGIADGATDDEGELVHPLFATDEAPDFDETCHSCSGLVREGTCCTYCDSTTHTFATCPAADADAGTPDACACGDGCNAGDCMACDDDLEPAPEPVDDYDQRDYCDCANCVAAAEYVGPVE